MEIQQARENRAKPRDVDRGRAGDVDNNTPVYSDITLANMNAETDGINIDTRHGSLLDPAQGAQLCLLAAKSPKSNIYKAYDKTRRARSFIPHWVVEYPWLEFNAEKECMFCIYCREYQRTHDAEFTNTFVHGATNFRLDSVKAHDNSTKHRQVMLVMSGKIASVPKPASKQAIKPSRAGTSKGVEEIDRLRVGAFFEPEDVDGYDETRMMGATCSSSIHRSTDDEGNQRHYIPPSADLTEEPFYPPNPMAKYIKTLQKIYPHLPLNELSETSLATTVPQQPSSSRVGDEAEQLIEMEENREEYLIKDEPLSPGLEEQEKEEREPGEGEGPSTSMGGRGRIERAVPPMRKMWMVNTNGATSLSQEEEEEEEENDAEYDRAGNEPSNHHLDDDDEGEAAEGVPQHSGAMTDFFINPVVPVYRQGKRTTRLLPKAKRQKLEMIMARQMQGEDIMNISEDRLGDQRLQSNPEVEVANSSSSNDPHWKRLAESFAIKYNQLSEDHTNLMKLFQNKVSKLEKKCNDLEQACQTREKAPHNNSTQQDGIPGGQGASGSSLSSPRISMYSSVIVLQVQGQDPINIRSNADTNFNTVQENLSQNGIHISLGANNIPNTIEEQLSLHSRAGGQRSHSKSASPSASSRIIGDASGENVSRYDLSPERVETRTRDSNLASGVGSALQNDLEVRKSDLSGHENQPLDKHGYLIDNGIVAE
eukprot:XP_011669026.1 PREDICTED: uncharacterized protein LOC100893056 [Strongylocentrotus purpuratus]